MFQNFYSRRQMLVFFIHCCRDLADAVAFEFGNVKQLGIEGKIVDAVQVKKFSGRMLSEAFDAGLGIGDGHAQQNAYEPVECFPGHHTFDIAQMIFAQVAVADSDLMAVERLNEFMQMIERVSQIAIGEADVIGIGMGQSEFECAGFTQVLGAVDKHNIGNALDFLLYDASRIVKRAIIDKQKAKLRIGSSKVSHGRQGPVYDTGFIVNR